ncbi:PilZ domain-containing protein [Hyphomicrobium methylovorum]|uniref:PilZ domain-containing protein n=1 Tax=Hyphomicrobium methylovorum TaxID=84 RepID=UPI0015E730AE|nr:PilZ domain-containing protein [Hyphomicrobium methylovorum]MBA2125928.1 PilZ domain-containing protein [Hyphomicrobium methylovorum]
MLNTLRKTFEPSKRVQPSVNASATAVEPLDGNSLFEALVCELHWTALQIGAVASAMNAALAFKRPWMLRSCSNLLPVESPLVRSALRSWRDIALPPEPGAAINRIYLELLDARTVALPLVLGAGNFVAPAVSIDRLEQLTMAWRKLAEDCRDAVLALEPETRWRLDGTYTGNALVLGKFLKEVAAGAHSCINRQGEVALPILPQRRRSRTYNLSRPCKVTAEDAIAVGRTMSISTNGIDFVCPRAFRTKESVLIELQNGRKFPSLIACAKAGKTSARFDQPLSENDPLFTES